MLRFNRICGRRTRPLRLVLASHEKPDAKFSRRSFCPARHSTAAGDIDQFHNACTSNTHGILAIPTSCVPNNPLSLSLTSFAYLHPLIPGTPPVGIHIQAAVCSCGRQRFRLPVPPAQTWLRIRYRLQFSSTDTTTFLHLVLLPFGSLSERPTPPPSPLRTYLPGSPKCLQPLAGGILSGSTHTVCVQVRPIARLVNALHLHHLASPENARLLTCRIVLSLISLVAPEQMLTTTIG